MKSIHEGTKFACKFCDFQATQKGNLLTHTKSKHSGIRFGCTSCEFQATQKGNLQNHMKTKHFVCMKCNFQATQRGNLQNHIRLMHRENKMERSSNRSTITPQNPAIQDLQSPYEFMDECQPITTYRAKPRNLSAFKIKYI